jgi:hypothetical protein
MPDWKLRIDRERRTIDSAHQGFLAVLARASAACGKGALRSNAQTRSNLFRSLDKELRGSLNPLRSRYDELPSRSGRTAALESCHVALMSDSAFGGRRDLYRLTSVRIALLPDEIEIELLPLYACIRPHSAERVLERANEYPDNAMHYVAQHMLDWLLIPYIVDDTLEKLDLTRLSVPGGEDEMVLGYVDRTCALPVGELFKLRAGVKTRIEIPASPYSPGVYVANTFLGPMEFKPMHGELRDCLVQWRDHCGLSYWSKLEDGIWPTRVVRPPVRGGAKLPEGASDALRDLFFEEKAILAVQSTPPARVFERGSDGLPSFDEVENEFYNGGDTSVSHRFI